MNRRTARFLAYLYPASWRRRYREEFIELLEDEPSGFQCILTVIGGALTEHCRCVGEIAMNNFQRTLLLVAYGYLAAVAAGTNLYWIVDDTPLVDAVRAGRNLDFWLDTVALGSALALAGVLGILILAGHKVVRFALDEQRRNILMRLMIPPAIAVIVTLELFASVWNGHLVVESPMTIRWIEASITLLLLICALVVIAVRQTRLTFVPGAVLLVAASIVVIALSVTGWAILANHYAHHAFHSGDGLLGSSMFRSWVASFAVFLLACISAVRGATLSTTQGS
jgi:hypothetical protein